MLSIEIKNFLEKGDGKEAIMRLAEEIEELQQTLKNLKEAEDDG